MTDYGERLGSLRSLDSPRPSGYPTLQTSSEGYRSHIDSREPRSPVLKDSHPKHLGTSCSPAIFDLKIQSISKLIDEEYDRGKVTNVLNGEQVPRNLFQKNNDATNQGVRANNEGQQVIGLKKYDQTHSQLDSSKKPIQTNSIMDQENLISSPNSKVQAIQESSSQNISTQPLPELKLSPPLTEISNLNTKCPELTIIEEMVVEPFLTGSNPDGLKPLPEDNHEQLRSSKSAHQEQKSSSGSEDSLLSSQNEDRQKVIERDNLLVNSKTEYSDLSHSVNSGEPENKENISPAAPLDMRQCTNSSDNTLVLNTSGQMMDMDKEPAFADSNLEDNNSVIVDDEKNHVATNSTSDIQIKETEILIVHPMTSSKKEAQGPTLEREDQDLFAEIIKQSHSQKNQQTDRKRLEQSPMTSNGDRRTFTNLKASVVIKKSQASIANKVTKREQESHHSKSSIVKRPPILASLGRADPSTPKSKQASAASQRSLQASKESIKNRNTDSALKIRGVTKIASPGPYASITADSVNKKPSIPKFLHKLSTGKLGELKLACDIPLRQAEAEAVLTVKKPPVPKFGVTKENNKSKTSSRMASQEQAARKPAVPKLVELLKKR